MSIDIANAYLLAANDVALAGRIRRGRTRLECAPATKQAAALNLEVEMRDMGRLSLSTCLLEQRDEPYSLMLELARHCIKHFIAKCDDWQIWDHPVAVDALVRWNQARRHFTAAMTTQNLADADDLSLRALVAGLKASELLAVSQARVSLHRRFSVKAASKMVLGIRVDPRTAPTEAAEAARSFDMISVPLCWGEIEKTPGKYDFSRVTPWFDFAQKAGRTVLAGPVIDLQPTTVPPWIAQKRGEFGPLRDGIWRFCDAVGREFAGRTGMWNIASGINCNAWWTLNLEEMVELSRRAVVGLRQARKGVPTLLECPDPFGHLVASRAGAISPRGIVDALVNDGIHLDCLMLQFVMGEPGARNLTRNLLEVSALLDTYRPLRKSIFASFGAPSAPASATAGYWRTQWSAKSQAVWASKMFAIAMSKPHVGMVLWDSLIDGVDGSLHRGALDARCVAKPMLNSLLSARRALAAPIGPWSAREKQSTAATTDGAGASSDESSDESSGESSGENAGASSGESADA